MGVRVWLWDWAEGGAIYQGRWGTGRGGGQRRKSPLGWQPLACLWDICLAGVGIHVSPRRDCPLARWPCCVLPDPPPQCPRGSCHQERQRSPSSTWLEGTSHTGMEGPRASVSRSQGGALPSQGEPLGCLPFAPLLPASLPNTLQPCPSQPFPQTSSLPSENNQSPGPSSQKLLQGGARSSAAWEGTEEPETKENVDPHPRLQLSSLQFI